MRDRSVGVWWSLAWQSAWSRRGPLALLVLAIAVAVAMVVSVMQLRQDTRDTFSNAISGVDLIVGARASPMELMLYSVFHLGRPVRNMSYSHYEKIVEMPSVGWAVPLQLGDSFQNFPVVGTTAMFFSKVGGREGLAFAQGQAFTQLFDVVLGAEVAKASGLRVGDAIVVAHGRGDRLAQDHSDTPFRVSGVLKRTGTPVDRSVLLSLAGFEAMHVGWEFGSKPREAPSLSTMNLTRLEPSQLTAVLVGLESRTQVFAAKRTIESMGTGVLMAILPGVTLDELWSVLAVAEATLSAMVWLVLVSALLGVVATLLISMAARRREFSVLRALGASPLHITRFILLEALLVGGVGMALGWLFMIVAIAVGGDWLTDLVGVRMQLRAPDAQGWAALGSVVALMVVASLVPAWRAFRLSLHDGLYPPTV
ncbi:MAG: ABC transporter permease [Burkholderiaceae bacterium]